MTARLTRRRAKALVALRLTDLDHGADYMTAAAFEELFVRSNESEAALLAALNATLFLASTEDAAWIEGRHVKEATAAAEPVRLQTSETARGPARWLAGGLVACCATVALLLQAGRLPPPLQAPVRTVPVPVPPAAEHRSVPVNAALEPSLQPEDPPLQVTLVFPAYDQVERVHVGGIAALLQQSGISQVRIIKIHVAGRNGRPIPRNRVFYFFRQDLGLARRVATLLDAAGANDAPLKPWSPHLVLAPPGVASHPPGSIEAYLP